MKISIIQPTRNNLKYLKWSYQAIRKNQGNHEVQICVADDASTDGTKEWLEEISKTDKNLNFIVNESGKRLGHTILYDRLVNEVAKHELCMIYHADMYLMPMALDAIEYYMFDKEQRDIHITPIGYPPLPRLNRIVSLTRIEPPLHPPGPEKVIADFGTEPENFNEEDALEYAKELARSFTKDNKLETKGIFAPWAFFKSTFNKVHGHDPLYAPQSKEDSDIFNKFMLAGVEFIQTWTGFVYHMTSRGSRFNPTLTQVGTNSDEWNQQNIRSTRNFIRKWGHFVKHTDTLEPIVPPKYDVGLIIENCNMAALQSFEPWCSTIYVSNETNNSKFVEEYIKREQPNTLYDLTKRVKFINTNEIDSVFQSGKNDVMIRCDARQMNPDYGNVIVNLSEILADSGQIGEMTYNLMEFKINKLEDYSHTLLEEQNNIEGVR